MLGEGGKSHRKKKSGKKAEKKKNSAARKENGGGKEATEAAKRNPKAFIFSSRGKAKIQAARSADKDQKRMHGMHVVMFRAVFVFPGAYSSMR
jgi:ribosome biogenesis protein BMS1